MSRDLTGAMEIAVAAPQLAPVWFFEADFSGGYARAWNGVGTIVWDGKLWLGTGTLLALGPVEETRELEETQCAVSLSGVDPTMVSIAYGDFSQGRALTIWLGNMDVASGLITDDPARVFRGRMDSISDTDDGDTAVITVTASSSISDPKRIRARYYTDQDQQRLFPGDRSFRFIPSLQDRNIYWGVREGSPQIPSVTL
jgi:hypothetical protein